MGKPFSEAISKGNPIMTIHTHGTEANFSFLDYAPLIWGDPHLDIRMSKSMMVLCPGMQLLAISTKDTPMLPVEDAYKLMGKRDSETNIKTVSVLQEFAVVLSRISDRKQLIDTLFSMKDLLEQKQKGAFEGIIKEINVQENESAKLDEKMKDETKNANDEASRIINTDLMSFSREMNVKLYFSQDMRTFKEFSA
jgi:hypothetical protein